MRRSRRRDVGFYTPWVTERLSERTDVSGSGGAETQAVLITRALARRGLKVSIVVHSDPGVDLPASDGGVDIVTRRPYDQGGPLRRVREIGRLWAGVRASDAKVVVTYCAGFWVGLVGLCAKLSRRRFVFASASDGDFQPETWLGKRRERFLYRLGLALTSTIVVQTEEQVQLCERRLGRVPILIKSACEPAERSERPSEAFLWAARADANKRPLEYLELARSLPDARFWMVVRAARGPEFAELWAEVQRAAETIPNLELLPFRPRSDLMELMERAVAIVSTSELEGLPNVFLEGWARGIPSLALSHDPDGVISRYRLGGFAEGRRDRLVDLARELWNTRADRDGCAARCRAYVQANHSIEEVGAQWAAALGLSHDGAGR